MWQWTDYAGTIRYFILTTVALLFFCTAQAQQNTYILNGSATQNTCNCYTLTPDQGNQSGSVWNATKINLNNPFNFVFNVFLGCKDGTGADGMVFILQPVSTNVGTTGSGMGFQGIVPSIGIALDTWQNGDLNDPAFDHISIQANGNSNHNADLVPVAQASPLSQNIEDCQWHTLRIIWDPVARSLKAFFDGALRLETTVDLIATIFNNDPLVYWGFSAGTGGSSNLQQFCTALNPRVSANITNDATCIGTPVIFTSGTSESFTTISRYYWNFGDGSTSPLADPPPHLYAQPGVYEVKMVIEAMDGCISDTSRKTVTIGDIPIADFDIFDTCANLPPRIINKSATQVGIINQWQWDLDGTPFSTQQVPVLIGLAAGNHQLKLTVKSNHGCMSSPIDKQFTIHPVPTIDFTTGITTNTICLGTRVNFTNNSQPASAITGYYWNFGDGNTNTQATPPSHLFAQPGVYEVKLAINDIGGCNKDTSRQTITVGGIPQAAFDVFDTCAGLTPRLNEYSSVQVTNVTEWQWDLDGAPFSTQRIPALAGLTPGSHQLKLIVKSNHGCASPPIDKQFTIHPVPTIDFATNLATNTACVGTAINFTNNSQPTSAITGYYWNFGDGNTNTQATPPPHLYAQPGVYEIKLAINDIGGCNKDTSRQTITIGGIPQADFEIFDTCAGLTPRLNEYSTVQVTNVTEWQWNLDGVPFSNQHIPVLTGLAAGNHQLTLTVKSNHGCTSPPIDKSFTIHRSPAIEASAENGCVGDNILFNADEIGNPAGSTQWNWKFDDNREYTTKNFTRAYNQPGAYETKVQAISTNGCPSNEVSLPFKVVKVIAKAGNDTAIIINEPFQLRSSYTVLGNPGSILTYTWSPSIGLNDPSLASPVATLQDNQTYFLSVVSEEGCRATDEIKISVFKEPAIYVPTAFSPNNDGRNDILKPVYVSIKQLDYFSVYNRWGERIFTTKDKYTGWDGRVKSVDQSSSVFVWIVRGIDINGKVHEQRGTVLVIR